MFTRMFPSVSGTLYNFIRLSLEYGQWRSMRARKSVGASGEPIPWYTYPAIEYLCSFNFKECDVFEFGAGNSSLFWSARANSIISVEDTSDWFQFVTKMAQKNQIVIHRDLEADYVKSLSEQGKPFHVIVIDGKWRMRCAGEAIKYLAKGGMIILDNSDWYPESSRFLRENGFFQIDFSGFAPINGYCSTTSMFIQTPTDLQRNYVGPAPIGGLKHRAD